MAMSMTPRFSPKDMNQTMPSGTRKNAASQRPGGRLRIQNTAGFRRQLSIQRNRDVAAFDPIESGDRRGGPPSDGPPGLTAVRTIA